MTTGETTPYGFVRTKRCAEPAFRAAIAAHFAGRTSPDTETALRAHLLGCADCDARYRRHLVLARLDPRALGARERLGRGLGFRGEGWWGHRRNGWALAVALALPAAVLLLLAVLPRQALHGGARPSPAASDEFAARGGARDASAFWTYRVGPDGTPRLAAQALGRADEVAFAYSNIAGRPFLMIFGVDEHRHLYWFHPGWSGEGAAPQALSAHAGPGPHELPEAIRQPFDGGRLRVYAAFGDQPFDATTIGDAVRAAGDGDPSRALGAKGITAVERTFRVIP